MTVLSKVAQLLRDRPKYRNSDKLLIKGDKMTFREKIQKKLRTGIEVNCVVCGVLFYAPPSRKQRYCSSKCYHMDQANNTNKGRFKNGHKPLVFGENHHFWAGDDVGYSGVHKWVYKELGQPSVCKNCGTTKAKRFEWSNISGEYKRVASDWQRLCRRCHHKYDKISVSAWATRRANQ